MLFPVGRPHLVGLVPVAVSLGVLVVCSVVSAEGSSDAFYMIVGVFSEVLCCGTVINIHVRWVSMRSMD
jgi:hypothetical protein